MNNQRKKLIILNFLPLIFNVIFFFLYLIFAKTTFKGVLFFYEMFIVFYLQPFYLLVVNFFYSMVKKEYNFSLNIALMLNVIFISSFLRYLAYCFIEKESVFSALRIGSFVSDVAASNIIVIVMCSLIWYVGLFAIRIRIKQKG